MPPRQGLCFPGIETMFDRCVCFGLLFTLDDNLDSAFILPYGTFSFADASTLLIPISGLVHVGLKPSTYGRAARLYTECTQPEDCLSHSPLPQIHIRAATERSLSGTPMHLVLVDAPNRAVPINRMFHARLEAFTRFRFFEPYGRDIAIF